MRAETQYCIEGMNYHHKSIIQGLKTVRNKEENSETVYFIDLILNYLQQMHELNTQEIRLLHLEFETETEATIGSQHSKSLKNSTKREKE